MTAEIPRIQAIMTGCNKFIFCLNETMNIAAIVATNVAIMHGIKILIGSAEPLEARIAMILTGINVSPDA